MSNDAVENPSHYNRGKIECIDYIIDQNHSYCISTAIKYIVRAGFKDPNKMVEDLQKAIFYIKHDMNRILASNRNGEEPVRVYSGHIPKIKTTDFIADQKLPYNRGAALISLEMIRRDHPSLMTKNFLQAIDNLNAEISNA